MSNAEDTVTQALKEHFGSDISINHKSHLIDDLDGDEMDTIEVSIAIEEKLGITIPEEVIEKIATVGDLIKAVANASGNI